MLCWQNTNFQSLLGCFTNHADNHLVTQQKPFNPFWDASYNGPAKHQLSHLYLFQSLLGCFSTNMISKDEAQIATFNPFWDASKLLLSSSSILLSFFQSLLGCFRNWLGKCCSDVRRLSIPFGMLQGSFRRARSTRKSFQSLLGCFPPFEGGGMI